MAILASRYLLVESFRVGKCEDVQGCSSLAGIEQRSSLVGEYASTVGT